MNSGQQVPKSWWKYAFFPEKIEKKGLNANVTLKMLSIKGNFIGDEGAGYIAEALEKNKIMQELDVSFNEIGPKGFADLIKVLPSSNLISLCCNRNPLGDECLAMLSTHLADQASKLRRVELCTCKLSDKGFAQLLQALQTNKTISNLKLTDNYFSESIEVLLISALNTNTTIVEMGLAGNRLSHTCLKKVKKLEKRNMKVIEDKEPNKLRAKIYKLKYEQKKLEKAQENLKNQKLNLQKIISDRDNLKEQIESFKQSEQARREMLEQQIKEQKDKIRQKEEQLKAKKEQLKQMQEDYKKKIEDLTAQYEEQVRKKESLEKELEAYKKQLEEIEEQYPKQIEELKHQISETRKMTEEYERKNEKLNEEIRALKAKKGGA